MWTSHNFFNWPPTDRRADCLYSCYFKEHCGEQPSFRNVISLDLSEAGLAGRAHKCPRCAQRPDWHDSLTPRFITQPLRNTQWWKQIISGAPVMDHHTPPSEEVTRLGKIQPSPAKRTTSRNPQACSRKGRVTTVISQLHNWKELSTLQKWLSSPRLEKARPSPWITSAMLVICVPLLNRVLFLFFRLIFCQHTVTHGH